MNALSDDDRAFLIRYVTTFGAAGIVVGLAWPWIKLKVVRHLAFYAAGCVAIAGLAHMEREIFAEPWMLGLLIPFGVIFGLGGIYYFEHNHPERAGVQKSSN